MKIDRIENMWNGWFVGDFEPNVYRTKDFEVGCRVHLKQEDHDAHYHTEVREINYIVRGKMRIQGEVLGKGDIFILEPYEISDAEFLEETEIVCVKTPSANDKVII